MFRQKNRLLAAALACASNGVPVRPAPPLQRLDPVRHHWRCGCGDDACATPGAHPAAGSSWLTDADAVGAAWASPEPPNLLITSTSRLAIWRLPRVVGAYGLRLFEQRRPGVWPPVMKLPDGDWIVCTRATEPDPADTGPLPSGVKYLAPGTPIIAPPSRWQTGRRARWLWSPGFPSSPLPSAESVLSLVVLAETQQHQLLTGRSRHTARTGPS